MLLTAEQKCLLWLSSAEVTPGHLQQLLAEYETAEGIWDAFGREGGPRFKESTQAILAALHSPSAIEDLLEKLRRKNVSLLFQTDEAYPPLLSDIQDPPYLLYYAGRIACLRRPMIGIVGNRRASAYGMEMASMIARELSRAGVCVVSGLARGIDEAAHQGALAEGGTTVGILGSGINVPYPPEHTGLLRKIAGGIGLVISEYPLDASPVAYHFPHRNRIISGLSLGVVFVEGRIQSGAMHTVHAALAQGREVFAVPGRVDAWGSEGPHAILREGARIITSGRDLLDDLGLTPAEEKPAEERVELTSQQRKIVDCLRRESMDMQQLSQALSLSAAQLIPEMGTLEILGVVRREAGNRFYLPIGARQ